MSDEPPPPVPRRPLRLLSLDGGGIRGYAEILILHNVMHRIKFRLNLTELPKPCDYFDLIGGTSTGGIIAVCLARLRLSTQECLKIYTGMSKKIFQNERRWSINGLLWSRFDANILATVIKDQLKVTEIVANDEEAPMLEPEREVGSLSENYHFCRGLVTATPGSDPKFNAPRLLRTYQPRQTSTGAQQVYTQCKIWEAVRATSAAPSFFDPIVIDKEPYVDGGFGCNNPAERIYEEGLTLLEPGQHIGCLVSIGTGIPAVMPMQDQTNPLNFMAQLDPLLRVATDCDSVHRSMLAKSQAGQLQGKYFRFNVQQGAQGISLWMWEKLPEMDAHTNAYIRNENVNDSINELVDFLLADP